MLPGDGPLHVAVRHALQSVIDPELGIDIVSLGLVYGLSFEGDIARVELTMTTPSCPLGEHLRVEAQRALSAVPGVGRADVRLVWEPPWSPARMSKEARRSLGWPA
jgi:metal-sulfur cluster biosynthetic enzyme